jgi:homoserine dehydrogenase
MDFYIISALVICILLKRSPLIVGNQYDILTRCIPELKLQLFDTVEQFGRQRSRRIFRSTIVHGATSKKTLIIKRLPTFVSSYSDKELIDIDIVIEVIGGLHPAKEAVLTALSHGKSVVTANKELMAHHGEEIRRVAANHGCHIAFEASVLGGIPVIHTLQTYFSVNHIQGFRGIMNGVNCKFCLTVSASPPGIEWVQNPSEFAKCKHPRFKRQNGKI